MQDLNNKKTLLDLLAQGATVITPNNRLSGALLQEYFNYCHTKTVTKPKCYPYNTALIKSFNQLIMQRPELPHPVLLNEAQCQHLWRKIIKAEPEITYSEGLLSAVMQAWEHCQQWQIDPKNPEFQYTPQTRTFQKWWLHFNKQLDVLNAINEHQIIPYILQAPDTLFSQPVIWVCFDDFNPQQLTLQNHLSNNKIAQYRYDLKQQTDVTRVFAAKDIKEEYQQLISWLKLKIDKGEQKIGVVIPNLQQESRSLKRIIQHHFEPQLVNISLGQPLSEFPLVAHALVWLHLKPEHLSHFQAALLLQSPYLGNAKEEFINRSQVLQDSTLLQKPSFQLQSLIKELTHLAPQLAERLKTINVYPENASPQHWIDLFQNRLNALGFPGDYGLNSENYQCYNRFSSLFDEFRQLHLISTNLSQNEALDALMQLADNTIFQAQKTHAPIHISGLLEASGCEFDSLWIMGLTDQCLPQKPRLSAFIPPDMQRKLLMPHSLPARELVFAKQTLQRLRQGSAETVFSYARFQGDTPNLPCSLILNFPPYDGMPIPVDPINQDELIPHDETYIVPLLTTEKISGGTALLAYQAKCPFKAFAEHRLKAKPSQQTSEGLDAKDKGIIVHKVMELLWRQLGSQKELLQLNDTILHQYIDQSIQTALSNMRQFHSESVPALIKDVEFVRLKRLVHSLLEWEKLRPEFEIAALEESYTLNLAGLDFTVRVDRLDCVEGSKWVIDYKSSLPASKPWNEERPTEPQLLLYALLDKEINTLLLIQLKTGKILCSGLSENKLDIKGVSALKAEESWEHRRNEWQLQLTDLAEEFQKGFCLPQPATAALCEQCDFQNLCRFRATEHSN
ncbi:PD-(D/E)XK nuclease family protein [Legionella bononiensis]|uniref:PD-(D/E)XK nuclease family protein n=1 Tax=Legionella bononiensis TaxID=2793102 RepID=A0ABS1WAE7_9GAMM|nr:PD-(D/E)XK nuclease family protein [Legionella bononiensis]MBL7480432.1 PD-(D/E)XK nuclease family protein [Legionella bononiensis]MBL7526334.1 PD-(D/E)XK nuclease family protein [Legionella bononiensis]MBL7563172.1 PD-(D/E)XK nuclease family protein [Legionella bononiensis]